MPHTSGTTWSTRFWMIKLNTGSTPLLPASDPSRTVTWRINSQPVNALLNDDNDECNKNLKHLLTGRKAMEVLIHSVGNYPNLLPEKHIYTTITSPYLSSRKNNKVINITLYKNQNKHYHIIYIQNWHSSEPTNLYSY